ncbi:MAG TPA: class I SAM-dependent methyltransferase [Solirubrobacteraceae bacterium]|nr:class I SAM-dependent methyltransferase [Solirubrobacteraceae bacterium]
MALKTRSRIRTLRYLGPGPTILGPVLHHRGLDPPTGIRRLTTRLNQSIFEAGRTPVWVWDSERCRRYWATRTSDGADNRPVDYARKPVAIVDLLHDFWTPEVSVDDEILELGCNVGANLERLRQLGYRRLRGAEINANALAELPRHFPELAADVGLLQGSFEELLATLEAGSVHVVFTMAVLLHLHPQSDFVFDEMVRIAGRYVCVVEAESATLPYIFARDYGRVFTRRGWREVRCMQIATDTPYDVGADYHGYTARLLERR